MEIRGFEKINPASKCTEHRNKRAKLGRRRVCRKTLILDDEPYVPKGPEYIPVRKYFDASKPKGVDYSHKVNHKQISF